MQSIMQTDKKCYVSGATAGLHKHHIFFGRGLRSISDKHGFWVWLRADLHNTSNHGVHFDKAFDLRLKQECQAKYEEVHTRDEFMSIIGRSYL